MSDYIRAKYAQKLFAIDGDPTQWLRGTNLANGWSRHLDEESNAFFYACGETTVWEPPPEATLPAPPPSAWWAGCEGWLEKKSGGKEGSAKAKLMQKWDKRFFVLGTSGKILLLSLAH